MVYVPKFVSYKSTIKCLSCRIVILVLSHIEHYKWLTRVKVEEVRQVPFVVDDTALFTFFFRDDLSDVLSDIVAFSRRFPHVQTPSIHPAARKEFRMAKQCSSGNASLDVDVCAFMIGDIWPVAVCRIENFVCSTT